MLEQNKIDATLRATFNAAKVITMQIPLSYIADNGLSEIGWAAEQKKLFDNNTQWIAYCVTGMYIANAVTEYTPMLLCQFKIFSDADGHIVNHLPVGWTADRDPLDNAE